MATLGGRKVRLCVTLRALAAMEHHFGVTGLEALGERLKSLSAADLSVVLSALCMEDISTLDIGFQEALDAVVAAFGALR
ncbi:gene transfer agent family protein [Asticcacaulis machinosus]|uniref:Gene transfer agent family protein n=1 Tax=Asticcacaulis machinosus TaxID=2984211 RepID=A0ABT5HLY0_9CAUL|nr:gene transfer agent family protein [Asticcacaulis machinosus]MDC7677251.1 gene transfer agent family protein [Asticcacaulis machinosus]